MAKEEQKEGEGEKAPPAGGKKKKIIIIAVLLLVLVGGGVGAFFAFSGGKGGEEGEEAADAEEEDADHGGGGHGEEGDMPGAIMPLETFIVNLQIKGSFLKVAIQLEFSGAEVPHSVEADVPKIRDGIIRLLSGKQASEVLTPDGKEKLKEEVRQMVNDVLGSEDVTAVYFTDFIVQ